MPIILLQWRTGDFDTWLDRQPGHKIKLVRISRNLLPSITEDGVPGRTNTGRASGGDSRIA